jgi:ribosomal protein S27AE
VNGDRFDAEWSKVSQELISGMSEWRLQHPRAPLQEIEAELDERLAKMRARMLEDAAMASAAADWRGAVEGEEAKCPKCGGVLQALGEHERRLQTDAGREVVLKRQYGRCPSCGETFFPSG